MAEIRAALAAATLTVGTAALGAPPSGFHDQPVLSDLAAPMSIAFLPDGRLLVVEKAGALLIADPQADPIEPAPYMTVPDVATRNAMGVIDIAIDPDFETTGWIYLYYVHAAPERLRISRFTHRGSSGDPGSECVLWQNETEIHYPAHLGGGLDFGPDGRLYLTTGDEFDESQAQDLTDAGGKVIRINTDGSIPSNPFADGPGGNLDEIWAYGLRNPFRARWDLPGERFFIGEVGGNNQAAAWEDLHLGVAGANFGWPFCEGPCDNPDFPACDCETHAEAVFAYPHAGEGASIIGGVVYRGGVFPAYLEGVYFYGDHTRNRIGYLTLDEAGQVTGDFGFEDAAGNVVAIEAGPDGALYYASHFDGTVRRIVFVPGDLDGSGEVSVADLLALLGQWGPCPEPCPAPCLGDVDGDCRVGTADLLLLLANWW